MYSYEREQIQKLLQELADGEEKESFWGASWFVTRYFTCRVTIDSNNKVTVED